ncbi:hypothetical protein HPB48_026607 [Haemaphysalis longicornis]|uniref:Uncharacterized protein n=1 Tax=Haemaphysalis longicornis TaxID=44386 RepID=A0A9J6H9X8_HAELO|nr:hypothetical protein HPB48_026607 [Haemaphysalis longicornis]
MLVAAPGVTSAGDATPSAREGGETVTQPSSGEREPRVENTRADSGTLQGGDEPNGAFREWLLLRPVRPPSCGSSPVWFSVHGQRNRRIGEGFPRRELYRALNSCADSGVNGMYPLRTAFSRQTWPGCPAPTRAGLAASCELRHRCPLQTRTIWRCHRNRTMRHGHQGSTTVVRLLPRSRRAAVTTSAGRSLAGHPSSAPRGPLLSSAIVVIIPAGVLFKPRPLLPGTPSSQVVTGLRRWALSPCRRDAGSHKPACPCVGKGPLLFRHRGHVHDVIAEPERTPTIRTTGFPVVYGAPPVEIATELTSEPAAPLCAERESESSDVRPGCTSLFSVVGRSPAHVPRRCPHAQAGTAGDNCAPRNRSINRLRGSSLAQFSYYLQTTRKTRVTDRRFHEAP